MMGNELISIYIPTFNRCQLLKRAVQSVLDQSYKNIEIIIVDDRSTDETHDYLETLVSESDKVKYFINEKNSGACFSRNFAISNAIGYFVTGLDDDDYFLPDRLSAFIEYWTNKNKETVLLFDDHIIKTTRKNMVEKKPARVIREDLLLGNVIGNQIFTTKDYILERGGYDINMPAWQDIDCWYRLLYIGIAENVNKCSLVVDMSHPHERITQSKLDKINRAFNLFSGKLLTCKDKLKLESQLLSYNISIKLYMKLLYKSIYNNDFILTKHLAFNRTFILVKKRMKKFVTVG